MHHFSSWVVRLLQCLSDDQRGQLWGCPFVNSRGSVCLNSRDWFGCRPLLCCQRYWQLRIEVSLIGCLSVVRTLTRTRKTRSIIGRRRSSACHYSRYTNQSFDHDSLHLFVASAVHFGPSPKVIHLKWCSILIELIILIIFFS